MNNKLPFLTLLSLLPIWFTGCGNSKLAESAIPEPVESGVERVLALSPGSAVTLPHPGKEGILVSVGYVDGDLAVTLFENETPTLGFHVSHDGSKAILHSFELEDGRWGQLVDLDGDGLPDRRVIFASNDLPGKTEVIHYRFEDARAEQISDGNAEKAPGVEREP
jgi:hypothetical protein